MSSQTPDLPPDPFSGLDATQPVRVLPRHLAGPGPVRLTTVWPFPYDDGWSLHQLDEETTYAVSSCLRLRTRYALDLAAPGNKAWTIAASREPFAPAAWAITLDAGTPAELVRDVHAEVLDLYQADGHRGSAQRLFTDDTPPHEAYAQLFARGWSHTVDPANTQVFRAPDGLAGLDYTPGISGVPVWRAWGGYPGEPHWQARFSRGTPPALVAAFTASLISTEPLHRTIQDVPFHTRRHLYLATSTPQQTPPSTPAIAPPPHPGAGRTR
ncbi:DUF317 domain-containing protein [Streptomyces sp. NPDC057654]|uniref:DUF317 domain-containing protein n=1 Tax=Streptomyces sp. NPDC057654 TaxID=3346196 RepID=UPI0036BC7837